MKSKNKFSFVQFFSVLSLMLIAGSVFYYFVIFLPGKEQFKQTQYTNCDIEAKDEALKLLKSKIEMAEEVGMTTDNQYKIWKQASLKGLYLKEDYNAKYESCIRRYGIKY